MVCAEYAGVASSNPLDAFAFGNNSSGATVGRTSAFSTSKAGLVVVFMTTDHTNGTFSAGAIGSHTATLRTSHDTDGGLEDTTFSSLQSNITASMNFSASNHLITMAGAFKAGP